MCRVLFNSDSCFVAKYNEYVDRLNAIRLLQALVAAGANSDAPMANAWISRVALEIGLKGEEFVPPLSMRVGRIGSTVKRKRVALHSPVRVRRLQELRLSHGANN